MYMHAVHLLYMYVCSLIQYMSISLSLSMSMSMYVCNSYRLGVEELLGTVWQKTTDLEGACQGRG